MSAGVYSLSVEQGAKKAFSVAYKDSMNSAIDLTGYAGRGSIRLKASDATPMASFEVNISNPTGGIIDIVLAPNALRGNANIKGKTYSEKTKAVYDIEVYTPDDEDVIRILNGTCEISPEVTK